MCDGTGTIKTEVRTVQIEVDWKTTICHCGANPQCPNCGGAGSITEKIETERVYYTTEENPCSGCRACQLK